MQKSEETKVEEPGLLRQEEDSNFTCEICTEPMLAIRKFKNGSLCKHPFCLDCIAKYIEVTVEESTGCIECPGLNCKQPLDPLSCRRIISKPIFEKWCDHLCDSTVLGSESCYCPYRDCSVLVLNECMDNLKKIKCPNCKKNFCFLCKIPWHAGYRCNESRHLRDRNDILVGELIEEKRWTRCYNCGHSVERVSGCRDIKCKYALSLPPPLYVYLSLHLHNICDLGIWILLLTNYTVACDCYCLDYATPFPITYTWENNMKEHPMII